MKLTTFAVLGLLGLAATTYAGASTMTGVSQQVQVESRGGKVVVRLTIDNAGERPVFVPKAVFEEDELFGRAFDIKNMTTGAEVDYIGPMVKRGPYTRADYLGVKPGSKHSNSIDITRSYDFKKGKHIYQLSYSGSYLGDLAALDAATPVSVAPVTFTHTGK